MAFRRRSRWRAQGLGRASRQRRKPIWVHYNNEQAVTGGTLAVIGFQLVGPEDYTDGYGDTVSTRQESATVVRSVGRVAMDLVVGAPGANGVSWSAALIVEGQNSFENSLAQDATDWILHLYNTRTAILSAKDTLQLAPIKGFTAAFIPNPGGLCSEFYGNTNFGEFGEWHRDYDVTVKRKLKTDDSLIMLVTAQFVCTVEGNAGYIAINNRTLILDD